MRVRLTTRVAPDGVCVNGLTVGREYEVLGIEADDFRVLDDAGEPYLFAHECFEITDPREPGFWKCETGTDGERYCYPPSWSRSGFFEDYFERVAEVRAEFWRNYETLYRRAADRR